MRGAQPDANPQRAQAQLFLSFIMSSFIMPAL
jgi:hypothetical protein